MNANVHQLPSVGSTDNSQFVLDPLQRIQIAVQILGVLHGANNATKSTVTISQRSMLVSMQLANRFASLANLTQKEINELIATTPVGD